MTSMLRAYYPETDFGGFTDVDGTLAFYRRVGALVEPESVLLDVGCGRGAYADDPSPARREARIFRGKCRRVIGIDVSEDGRKNPFLDEFRLIQGNAWPVEDGSVDACVCDYVLEHVEDVDTFFLELNRVLKTGGYLCIRTPNAWNYIALLARLVPNRLHWSVLSRAQGGRKQEDVFPTCYRCNTRSKLLQMFRKYGFDGCAYGYEAEPSYLSFSPILYALGVAHQHFAPGMFRAALLAFAKKETTRKH